tara:strand:- start:115 stop:744 length:630 start_codon:yes stop_codon:yes gene_type:complete
MEFYIISPPFDNLNFCPKKFDRLSDIIPVKFFQFRPKFKQLKKRFDFVEKNYSSFSKICKKKNIKMIINNDFEIAEKFTFDGIHLGPNDKDCITARKKFGDNFIIGYSCSDSIRIMRKSIEEGANYLAFGPVFKTKNKRKSKINIKKLLEIKKEISLPFTLIGGINHKNIHKLKKIQPNYVAIIDSLWNFKNGPEKSAILFSKTINERY